MIQRYIEAMRDALLGALNLATQWAIPLSLLVGLIVVGGVLALLFGLDRDELKWLEPRRLTAHVLGYGLVGLLLVASCAALKATKPGAQHAFRHLDQAEATSNAVPDAPVVLQSGPAVAALSERTYSSTLTLPPSFLGRLSAEGLNVLAPYLTDNSTQNVVKLRNDFTRKGRNIVFSRQATVLEEKPIAFSNSQVKVTFNRLAKRAYDAQFEGHYRFGNSSRTATAVHFLFSLPQAGTVRDLKITVGSKNLTEPKATPAVQTPAECAGEQVARAAAEAARNTAESGGQMDGDPNVYEWKGQLAPGETREAVVSYRVVGARVWSYDLGSTRRRVDQFQLDANANGDVAFARGSLQPTNVSGSNISWQLANVVTAQQLSLVFPSDEGARQLYLQSLSALPASLILFFLGIVAGAAWLGMSLSPLRLGCALALFTLGLGASTVATIYMWPLAALILCPLMGAALAALLLGRRSLVVGFAAALLPAAFLSANHSGLLVLVGCALTLGAFAFLARRRDAAF